MSLEGQRSSSGGRLSFLLEDNSDMYYIVSLQGSLLVSRVSGGSLADLQSYRLYPRSRQEWSCG